MIWPEDIPEGQEYYTHKLWRWDGGAKPWARQIDLPEIILYGETITERREAIRQLQDETMRAKLACYAEPIGDVWCLIHGIRSQSVLFALAKDEKSPVKVRQLAADCIRDPEALRLIAVTDCEEVRSGVAARIVSMAESPEQLKKLANDDLLPLYNRMIAALTLGDGPEILDLDGTDIYQKSDIVHNVIDKAKRRWLSGYRKK